MAALKIIGITERVAAGGMADGVPASRTSLHSFKKTSQSRASSRRHEEQESSSRCMDEARLSARD